MNITEFASSVNASLYLFGLALLAAVLVGSLSFFLGRMIYRRIRTWRWTPAVDDRVLIRCLNCLHGTIEEIDGTKLVVRYWPGESSGSSRTTFERSAVYFSHRPAHRR